MQVIKLLPNGRFRLLGIYHGQLPELRPGVSTFSIPLRRPMELAAPDPSVELGDTVEMKEDYATVRLKEIWGGDRAGGARALALLEAPSDLWALPDWELTG